MKPFLSRYGPALAWAAFILLVSSIPEPLETAPSEIATYLQETEVMGVGGVTVVSLVIHFVLYLVLGFLVARATLGPPSSVSSPFLLALALCTAFGVLDELYQLTVPGRGFEWIDILADGMGAAAGVGLWRVAKRKFVA